MMSRDLVTSIVSKCVHFQHPYFRSSREKSQSIVLQGQKMVPALGPGRQLRMCVVEDGGWRSLGRVLLGVQGQRSLNTRVRGSSTGMRRRV